MMKKCLYPERGREVLVSVLTSPVPFAFLAFLWTGVLSGIVPWWYSDVLDNLYHFLVTPLAGCAIAACILRRTERGLFSVEMLLLFVLLLWIIVPFAVRFGAGFSNVTAWFNAAAAFFGIYGLMMSLEPEEKEKVLRLITGLFLLLSFFWGGRLLYCFVSRINIENSVNRFAFGLFGGMLCAGTDCNSTAMVMLCAFFFALYGVKAFRNPVLCAVSAAAVLLLYWELIMTQSRSSLYATILALAAGVFAEAFLRLKGRHAIARVLFSFLLMTVFAAVLYIVSSFVRNGCLQWYSGGGSGGSSVQKLVRAAPDATLSERTLIWGNLFKLWKNDWKSLLIGFGPGKVGSLIVKGTYHEAGGSSSVHNGYLQFIADYGLIGAGMFFAFLLLSVRTVLCRLFEADGGKRILCLAAAAIMMVGMTESTPIIPLGLMNIILMFVLGSLADRSGTCGQK